jgi:glycine betaine catabolism A
MDYAPHLAQFRRLLAMVGSRGVGNPGAACTDTLPDRPFHIAPEVYVGAQRYAREIETVFRRAPLVLGHAAMLPKPGDTLVLDIIGQPLLLVRGRDQQIRGFLNVCRHRGTRLCNNGETGLQTRNQFTCPYHSWTYGLDGALKHVPLEDGFPGLDKTQYSLTPIQVDVREGVIFGIVDPAAPPRAIDPFLAGIEQDLAVHGFGDMQVFARAATKRKTNWKLIMDAFLESYHVVRLHKNTLGTFFRDNAAVLDRVGPHLRTLLPRTEFAEVPALPESQWDGRRHSTFAYMLYPNTILVLSPDYTSLLSLYPTAVDETLFSHTMLVPHAPATEKERDHWQRSFDLIEGGVFQAEDLFIAEQAQIGMASGANKTMLYGRLELGIRALHEELDRWTGLSSVTEVDDPETA